MKRLIAFSVIILSAFLASAQPSEFYGLKLGEKVTRQQIIDAVGENGIFNESSDSLKLINSSMPVKFHCFAPARLNFDIYSDITFRTLETGEFFYLGFTREVDDDWSPAYVDSLYYYDKNKLQVDYPALKNSGATDEKGNALYSFVNPNGTSVTLTKLVDEQGNMSRYEVAYYDAITVAAYALAKMKSQQRPTLQDTFFGLKFGSKVYSNQIKYAVGQKGKFAREQTEGNAHSYLFTDIYFAGNKWDFGEFVTSSDNELYWFHAYNSMNDGYIYDDERKDAKSKYDYLKGKLDEKYGPGEEDVDENGDAEVYYIGNNEIMAVISNRRSQSSGGEYRRYVGIEYIFQPILDKQNKASDDEF